MFTYALAGLAFCLIGWAFAFGLLLRYGDPMLSKYLNFKSAAVALVTAAPVVLYALFPKVPLEVYAACSAYIGVRLFHLDPKDLPSTKKDGSQ